MDNPLLMEPAPSAAAPPQPFSSNAAEPMLRALQAGLSQAITRAALVIEHKGGLDQAARSFVPTLSSLRSEPDEGSAQLLKEGGADAIGHDEEMGIAARRALPRLLMSAAWAFIPQRMRGAFEAIERAVIARAMPVMVEATYFGFASGALRGDVSIIGDAIERQAALLEVRRAVEERLKQFFDSKELQDQLRDTAEIAAFKTLGANLGYGPEFGATTLKPVARGLHEGATPTAQNAEHIALTLAVANAARIVNGIFAFLVFGALDGGPSLEPLLLNPFGTSLDEEDEAGGRDSPLYVQAHGLASHVFKSVGEWLQ